MRTAAYCRFSSDAQREASIRDQLRNIEAYCTRTGWPAPALYQDQAISGSRNDRPGYRALLDAAEFGAGIRGAQGQGAGRPERDDAAGECREGERPGVD